MSEMISNFFWVTAGLVTRNGIDKENGTQEVMIDPNQPAIRKWALDNVVIDINKVSEMMDYYHIHCSPFIQALINTNPITLKPESEVKDVSKM
jgi:hypothetical protein